MCIFHLATKVGLGAVVLGSVLAASMLAGSGAPAQTFQERPTVKPGAQTPPPITQKSLFDRVGGTYGIAAMVDDYVDHLVKDPVVMANPQVKAAVEKAAGARGVPGLKYQITALVIEGAGGPYKYHGRNMKDTHATMRITQSEWDAAAEVFRGTLARFSVPKKEQDELFVLIDASHDHIVVNGSPTMPSKRRGQ